jgi:hypothetical protein
MHVLLRRPLARRIAMAECKSRSRTCTAKQQCVRDRVTAILRCPCRLVVLVRQLLNRFRKRARRTGNGQRVEGIGDPTVLEASRVDGESACDKCRRVAAMLRVHRRNL